VKEDETSEACCGRATEEGAHKDFVSKPEGKNPLKLPMSRWEDDIKTTKWKAVDSIYFAQDRCQWIALVNISMNFWAS
jgi:hypothetical protein